MEETMNQCQMQQGVALCKPNSVQGKILSLIQEHPGDLVVFAERWGSDYKIGPPVSNYAEARKQYANMIRGLDINWKISVRQLTRQDFKGVI